MRIPLFVNKCWKQEYGLAALLKRPAPVNAALEQAHQGYYTKPDSHQRPGPFLIHVVHLCCPSSVWRHSIPLSYTKTWASSILFYIHLIYGGAGLEDRLSSANLYRVLRLSRTPSFRMNIGGLFTVRNHLNYEGEYVQRFNTNTILQYSVCSVVDDVCFDHTGKLRE